MTRRPERRASSARSTFAIRSRTVANAAATSASHRGSSIVLEPRDDGMALGFRPCRCGEPSVVAPCTHRSRRGRRSVVPARSERLPRYRARGPVGRHARHRRVGADADRHREQLVDAELVATRVDARPEHRDGDLAPAASMASTPTSTTPPARPRQPAWTPTRSRAGSRRRGSAAAQSAAQTATGRVGSRHHDHIGRPATCRPRHRVVDRQRVDAVHLIGHRPRRAGQRGLPRTEIGRTAPRWGGHRRRRGR